MEIYATTSGTTNQEPEVVVQGGNQRCRIRLYTHLLYVSFDLEAAIKVRDQLSDCIGEIKAAEAEKARIAKQDIEIYSNDADPNYGTGNY